MVHLTEWYYSARIKVTFPVVTRRKYRAEKHEEIQRKTLVGLWRGNKRHANREQRLVADAVIRWKNKIADRRGIAMQVDARQKRKSAPPRPRNIRGSSPVDLRHR